MKAGGIIESIDGDNITVKLFKEMGCSHCSACGEGNKFAGEYSFTSEKKLELGQEITFEINDKTILGIGLFVYIFPVIMLFVGYFIASLFSTVEGVKVLSSFIGLAVAFLFIRIFDSNKGENLVSNIEMIDEAYHSENSCEL